MESDGFFCLCRFVYIYYLDRHQCFILVGFIYIYILNVQIISLWLVHQLWMAVVVMIVWLLDLQLPVQSVPITTKVVSSNSVHDEVHSIQHYMIKFVSELSLGTPVSSTNKTDRYDILNWNIVESGVKQHKPWHC